MKIWAQTGKPLKQIKPQMHSTSAIKNLTLPLGATIDFEHMPLCVTPSTCLLKWLFYHGISQSKGSDQKEILQHVEQARILKQELDYDRIQSDNVESSKSYISWDPIIIESEVE